MLPVALVPYAWATINVRADTIAHQPDLLQRFVRALAKGLNDNLFRSRSKALEWRSRNSRPWHSRI